MKKKYLMGIAIVSMLGSTTAFAQYPSVTAEAGAAFAKTKAEFYRNQMRHGRKPYLLY